VALEGTFQKILGEVLQVNSLVQIKMEKLHQPNCPEDQMDYLRRYSFAFFG